MIHTTRYGWWLIWLAIVAGVIALIVVLARPADPQRFVRKMQTQIAQVRGLQFKSEVAVVQQSPEEFGKSFAARVQRLGMPQNEQVLRTLGLLASDESIDADELRKLVDTGVTKGEYDPYSGRLFVAKPPNRVHPTAGLDDLYARELYRALLDQHFDLKQYLQREQQGVALSSDARLARYLLIEGDALYATVLRRLTNELGRVPEYVPLEDSLAQRLDPDELVSVLDDPRYPSEYGKRRKPRREPGSPPTFVSQLGKAVERDAMQFVNHVRNMNRKHLDQLYTTSPPLSTAQILHPRKWWGGNLPVTIEWPAFQSDPAFADWELLEQDVLGELMLRTVFRVHGLSTMLGNAPDGWDGDRFAVLKRRDSGDMLLLLYTVWDRERQAAAFAEAYQFVLKEKYADAPQPVRVVHEGQRVVIVEGGEESSLDAFMKFAQSAKEIEISNTAVEK